MQAIILAAGMGKRLKNLTKENTKCMVKVNGITLIERMLKQLDSYNLTRIVIVVGYMGGRLVDFINGINIQTKIVFITNPIFDKTNNIYSLSLAKDYLASEDTLLFESDLIFSDEVLRKIIDDKRDTLALVDKYESWMDGTCVTLGDNDEIERFISGRNFRFEESEKYFKTVNIYKFSRNFSETYYIPFMEAYLEAVGNNEYYEQVLKVITMLDSQPIRALRLNGELWYEIDDVQDLDIAESLFASDETMLDAIEVRYGGYWRYPKLIDFCYLVNPYYPTKRFMTEMKSSFERLLTRYPSGMNIMCLLASKNYGVNKENIVVGNGAAELIKTLMEILQGKIGLIRPTFEEYPNRYDKNNFVEFIPNNDSFKYKADDLIDFYEDKDISNLILINPDNPSGNYIKKADIIKICKWADLKGISIILDESFADFADEEDNSLIEQETINQFKNLYIIKSISKSFGVPGLRLGVMVSGDEKSIVTIRKMLPIWNINSFAEFYMQIEEKYRNDYKVSLKKIRNERFRFKKELDNIDGLRTIDSQANFIMTEITNGTKATELAKRLLLDYNLIVKDLSSKIANGEYLRIAIRSTDDNNILISAIKNELNSHN